jgi:hypothetical protein
MHKWKWDISKLITQNIFLQNCVYPHKLQEGGEISILQIKSCDNLADLFMKSLPLTTLDKCVKDIGIHRLKGLQDSGEDSLWIESHVFLIRAGENITYFYRNQVTWPVQLSKGECYKVTQIYKFELQIQMSSNGQLTKSYRKQHKQHRHHHRSDHHKNRLSQAIKHMFINWSDQEAHAEFTKGHTDPTLMPSEGARVHV